MFLSIARIGVVENRAAEVRHVGAVARRRRCRGRTEQVGRYIDSYRFKSDFGDQRPKILGCVAPSRPRGDPEGICRCTCTDQDRPRFGEIKLHCFLEIVRHWPLVRSIGLGGAIGQRDPPVSLLLFKGRADLQGSVILDSDGAYGKQCDDEAIANADCSF